MFVHLFGGGIGDAFHLTPCQSGTHIISSQIHSQRSHL